MEEKPLIYYWPDEFQASQSSTSPSNVTDENDSPPSKRCKRSPSLTSTTSTRITEQSSSSGSSSLTLETYYSEREEQAEQVTRTFMALSSTLAQPRIIYRLPPRMPCPELVITVQNALNKGLGVQLIPLEFKVCTNPVDLYCTRLSDNKQGKIEEADGKIPDFAYDYGGSLSFEQLESLWDNIQEIYIKATECSRLSQDENAWSLVAYDILNFALRPRFRLRPINIKLQTIEPEMLPRLPHRDLCDISSGKIDYVFSFSPRSLEIDEILWQFDRQQIPLGLTTDPSLSSTPLFAGVIVRDKSGNVEEARLQLSLLFAAQFKKLTQLGKLQGKDISGCQQPLMLGWTVIGSDWCLYYAYRYISEGNETMYVNKAITAIYPNTTTELHYGIFKLIDIVHRVATYLENDHWPFLCDFLCPHGNPVVKA